MSITPRYVECHLVIVVAEVVNSCNCYLFCHSKRISHREHSLVSKSFTHKMHIHRHLGGEIVDTSGRGCCKLNFLCGYVEGDGFRHLGEDILGLNHECVRCTRGCCTQVLDKFGEINECHLIGILPHCCAETETAQQILLGVGGCNEVEFGRPAFRLQKF